MSDAPHLPYIKWYPTDWRADPRLRMCSLAARGLWIDLIGYMHEGAPYGHLTINDEIPTLPDITALVGRPLSEVRKAMAELEARQVYSVDEVGRMFSRRMVRDKAKAEKDRENGKGGGNPKLKGGVNPQDKAQIPEARDQKKDAAPAALDPEVELFRRGREVLGKQAGGLVSKLLTAKQKNIALARAAIEQASTKSDPREYVGRIISGPQSAGQPNWLDGIEGVI
jgi:hypothetical protein